MGGTASSSASQGGADDAETAAEIGEARRDEVAPLLACVVADEPARLLVQRNMLTTRQYSVVSVDDAEGVWRLAIVKRGSCGRRLCRW